jgi:hypothetical protein
VEVLGEGVALLQREEGKCWSMSRENNLSVIVGEGKRAGGRGNLYIDILEQGFW